MNITVISVRKNTDKTIAQLESVYLKRLKGKSSVRLIDIRPAYKSSSNAETVASDEAVKISGHLQGGSFTGIALDPAGKSVSTEKLSEILQNILNSSGPDIRFIIGGPFGLDKNLKNSCNLVLSLSALTFTHEFARLILLEQLFRCTSMWSGSGYHK